MTLGFSKTILWAQGSLWITAHKLGQEFVFGFLHKQTVIGITVQIENK